jgi:hypothetical protein
LQLAGVLEALNAEKILPFLQEISFVDKSGQRVERLAQILKKELSSVP